MMRVGSGSSSFGNSDRLEFVDPRPGKDKQSACLPEFQVELICLLVLQVVCRI
jgi:hypothetical protein